MQFTAARSAGGGNCFFDSIRIILASTGHTISVRKLRQVVASSLLNPDDQRANAVLLEWARLYSEAVKERNIALASEYIQMQPLFQRKGRVKFPLSQEDRTLVAHQLLKPTYFGDEYALDVMERVLKAHIVVLDGRGRVVRQLRQRRRGNAVMFLRLMNIHYQPLHIGGRYLWHWKELPAEIQQLVE